MLEHKHGGTITALTHIGHQTHRGVADWFFVGDVEWHDGSKSKSIEIAPWALCGTPEEVAPHTRMLSEYLEREGKWHDTKSKRDGRVYSWIPDKPEGRVAL